MPPKRKYTKKAAVKKYGKSMTVINKSARTIQAAVRRAIAKNIETKRSNFSNVDGYEIAHNSFQLIDSSILFTTQGVNDPNTANTANRIGDEVNLKGVAFKMMLELNERYSDITYRILVVKSAKGDTPTSANLFNGLSGNKMLDTLNTERFTIIHRVVGKIVSNNPGAVAGLAGIGNVGSGLFDNGNGQVAPYSRATKIVKFYIPGEKFVRGGRLIYENGGGQPKFFDYTVLVYAYSNYSTSEALGFNVARINDYIKVMYYKDA